MAEDDADPTARQLTRGAVVRLSALAIAIGGAWWLIHAQGAPDLVRIRAVVSAAGPWAPVAFVAAFASLTLIATPRNVLTTLGAALFGVGGGIALSWAAALLGAVVAFSIGRLLSRDGFERLTRGRLARVSAVLRDHGTGSVLAARLMPVVPFTGVNYGAGILGVRLAHFVLGTAVGIVPGTVAYAVVGAYGFDGPWTSAGTAVVLVALLIGGAAAGRRVWSRRGPERRPSPQESRHAPV